MSQEQVTVKIAKDLEDLIPTFLKNRIKEVDALRGALAAENYEQLRQIGHRMKGVGSSYGFNLVSEIGKQVEDGAKLSDRAALEASIAQYADYLSRVKVVYE